jgi:ATP/maltotriose-dependent transcriptional regulator MalT
VYGLLTGILTLAYVASVLLIQQIALALTGIAQSSVAIALSTLVIAALFQPIRHTLQQRIEDHFNPDEPAEIPVPAPLPAPVMLAPAAPTPAESITLEEPLSAREIEVLRLIAQGHSNQEVAARLYITEGTVKRHTTNLYGKLGVRSRTQAVVRGRSLGLIE